MTTMADLPVSAPGTDDIGVSSERLLSGSGKQLVKRQLNVNINEVSKISIEQIKKLIEIQAKKIDLTKWEYDRFVATCVESDYLDKGLIILFNYAGNLDKIEIFTRKYSYSRNNLIEQLATDNNISDLCESIKELAVLTLKLLYAIGSLRKLQSSPKPIMVQYSAEGQEAYSMTTQAILRITAGTFLRLDDAKKADIADNVGTTTLATLLSPLLDAFELQNLLSKVNKSVSMQDREILTTMRAVLEIEDKVEATWMSIQPEFTEPSKLLSESFPLLRLPYAEAETNANHFLWFNNVIGNYKGLCNAVLEELNVLQRPTSEASAPPKLTKKASSDLALRNDTPTSSSGKRKDLPTLEKRTSGVPGGPVRSKSQSKLASQKTSSPTLSPLRVPEVTAPGPPLAKVSSKKSSALGVPPRSPTPTPSSPSSRGAKTPDRSSNRDRTSSFGSRGNSPGHGKRYLVTTDMMYGTGMSTATYDSHDSYGYEEDSNNFYGASARGYTKTRHNPFTKVAAVTFSPAERMIERDLLKRGFRLAKKKGGGAKEIARRKIKIWWRIVFPRFSYLRRQCLKQFLTEVVLDLADNATTFAIIRTRRRLRWVRERAVVKIQRQFRTWMKIARKELSKITREQRKIVLDANLLAWCISVKGTCVVLKWFMRKHAKLRKLNPYRRPVSRARCVYGYWNMLQQRNQASLEKTTLSRARFKQYKRERAAVCIQKYVRRLINKYRMQEKHTYIFMKKMLKKFMQRHDIREKVEKRRRIRAATIKIQCAARGFLRRNALYRRFNSSILIFNFFKKIKATKNLRKTLRRSERPYKIRIDKISNIVEYFDRTEPLRVKISVWWHPLLHIVSINDFATVMSTKHPQYVTETAEVLLVPDDGSAELTPTKKSQPSGQRKYTFVGAVSSINLMASTKPSDGTSTSTSTPSLTSKWQAVFAEVIQIPGCHGNAAIKFEMFSGDRKYATLAHYFNEYGKLMFWNGDYDRPINLIRKTGVNTRVTYQGSRGSGRGTTPSSSSKSNAVHEGAPMMRYSIISGPPNRSKCSWGKVRMRGSGPGKRAMRGKGIIASFFENWIKFFLSMDEEYFMLFESRHSTKPFYQILLHDIKSVTVENGSATTGTSSSKFLSEDNKNIVLSTGCGDVIHLRLGKSGLRVLWVEVFTAVIAHYKKLDEDETKLKVSNHAFSQMGGFGVLTKKLKEMSKSVIDEF